MIRPRPRAFIARPAAPPRISIARHITSRARSWLSIREASSSDACSPNPALLIRTSTGSASASRRAATCSTSSRTERSAGSTSTATPCTWDSSAAVASRRSRSRATSTKSFPREASSLAKALPMPAVAPVINARAMGATLSPLAKWWKVHHRRRRDPTKPGDRACGFPCQRATSCAEMSQTGLSGKTVCGVRWFSLVSGSFEPSGEGDRERVQRGLRTSLPSVSVLRRWGQGTG